MEYDITKEYINIIRSKIKVGEYKNAIQSANKLIDYDPSAIAYYLRGICHYAIESYTNSIMDYDLAVNIDNKFAKAYFNRGVAKYRMKKMREAILDMEIAHDLFVEDNDIIAARKCVESIDIIRQEGV